MRLPSDRVGVQFQRRPWKTKEIPVLPVVRVISLYLPHLELPTMATAEIRAGLGNVTRGIRSVCCQHQHQKWIGYIKYSQLYH